MKFKLLTLLFVCIMESVLYNLDAKNYTTSATMDYVLITRTGTNKYQIEMYDTSQDNTSPFWTLTNVSITSTTLPTTQLTSSKNTNNIVYVNNTTGENNVSGEVTFTYLGNKYFQVTATASSSSDNYSWSSTGVYVDLPPSYLKYPTFTETIATPDGDGVISGCYAHFPFATSGITISSTQTTGANYGNPSGLNYLTWNPNDTQTYLRLTAYNSNKTTRNYLFLTFRNITTRNYNNGNGGTIKGPAVGTYQITGQSYFSTYDLWYSTSSGIVGDSLFFFESFGLYWNYIGSVIGNATSNTRPKDNLLTTKKLDYTFIYEVAEGKNGQMYIKITERSSNRIFITIGEPKEYTITYDKGSYGSDTVIANGTKTSGVNFTLSSSTYTRTGYTQTGWSVNADGSTNDYALGGTYSTDAGLDLYPYWEINKYTVTVAKNNNYYGTLTNESDNVRVINNVPYGTVITTGTGENANKVTINGTTVTATPAANDAQYTYAFSGWTNGAATVTGNMTVTANFTCTTRTYDITFKNADGTTLKKSDGTTDAVYSVAYGETPAYDGATPTKTADSEYTYTFNGWDNEIVAVTTAATYTATYSTTKVQYTLTWDVNGGNELTGTYTNGTIDWGTAIIAPADPTKSGYTFNGWDADNDGTADNVAATMPTSDVTYKALWNAISTDLVLKDGVTTGQTDIDFDAFKATYNGQTMSSVTLNRTFTAGNWATLCLPFYVDESQLTKTGLLRKVYEFRYATGSADAGKQVTFHFRVATSMEAGRGYLVKGTSDMNTSFTFTGVTINTSADTEADVNDLKGVNAYYDQSVSSDIAIVGVLRSGTLRAEGKKVMGLANNMIWYPHSSGNPMPAYRAYFYNPNASASSVMPRVRIVVEGEGTTELEVVDGELYDAGGDVRVPRKYIRNGMLIIERNGVTYDAQGKRL